MTSKENMTKTVMQVIQETLAEKGVLVPFLTLESSIGQELGLDSLDWAAVVVRLEEETGIDPFQQGLGEELRTVSDFVDLYLAAIS